jgi:hypothetical protein
MGGKGGGQAQIPPQMQNTFADLLRAQQMSQGQGMTPEQQAMRQAAMSPASITPEMLQKMRRAGANQLQAFNQYQGSQNVSGMIDRRTPEIRAAQEAYRRTNPQQASPLAGLASLSGVYGGMK